VTSDGPLLGVFGLSGSQVLGLTVLAALVTTVGNLLASWLKDFVFVRSFERWKDRRTLESLYSRYRKQLDGAAGDLRSRTKEICKGNRPPAWLYSSVLEHNPQRLEKNTDTDPYYQRYRLISTVYRLCAFLAWMELYRQELTFLDTGQEALNKRLELLFEKIRGDLADGYMNTASDFQEWRDQMIFGEEQRSIGKYMLDGDSTLTVMGYGAFLDLFEPAETAPKLWWIRSAKGLFLDPEKTKDFRLTRLKSLDGHLAETIELLKKRPKTHRFRPRRRERAQQQEA
jgi:hypothetical protein